MKEPEEDAHNGGSFAGRLSSFKLEKTGTILSFRKLKMRGQDDDLPQGWWFASTAIPLLAASIGPLANVLSIAALVTTWRVALPNNGQLPEGTDDAGVSIPDPHWQTTSNAVSLACGFFGNLCLLFNFTRRIRYIIALPLTIIAWYFATGILTAIVVAMNVHDPPIRPGETYSQGFWYAIIAACLYMIGSVILMINMLGYFLGHYPQHFELDDNQRTLILQTMMFFLWLAGGAGVFSKVCGFTYADALYFCDVTVLTVGFGDFVAPNTAGRGLILPYSLFGIIFLGLMIRSIRKFAVGPSKDNIVKRHQLRYRERTVGRSVTNESELRERLGLPPRRVSDAQQSLYPRRQSIPTSPADQRVVGQGGLIDARGQAITFQDGAREPNWPTSPNVDVRQLVPRKGAHLKRANRRRAKLIVLREERDRFNAMRAIQANTHKFKRYYALSMSVLAFSILWCVGALVFMFAERRLLNMTYFEALYFCYVSLLTIGYGDFSPKSNAGKPFFVVWSLIAVPTMTILISDMGDTVVSAINRGTFTIADWTVMPKQGVLAEFLQNHRRLKDWLERKVEERSSRKRVERGFSIQNPDEDAEPGNTADGSGETLEDLAEESPRETEHELAKKLALAIKKTGNDLRLPHHKKYSYEEWVEFTRLIRFSSETPSQVEDDEEEEGLVEWDWIGENSPMLAEDSESGWILDRLCESLVRYTRKQAREAKKRNSHRHQGSSDKVNSTAQSYHSRQNRTKDDKESHGRVFSGCESHPPGPEKEWEDSPEEVAERSGGKKSKTPVMLDGMRRTS